MLVGGERLAGAESAEGERTLGEEVRGYMLGLALALVLTAANNVLALAFGVLIVCLIVFGSLWVMEHLNQNMVPVQEMMQR